MDFTLTLIKLLFQREEKFLPLKLKQIRKIDLEIDFLSQILNQNLFLFKKFFIPFSFIFFFQLVNKQIIVFFIGFF
jgi:hypothetical protein